MITLLNTSILTSCGTFTLEDITLLQAIYVLKNVDSVQSAIGHESTAQVLSSLLGIDVPVNRINYYQLLDDKAIVFKLNGRAPEGKILSIDEINEIGYSFKLLTRTK